MAGPHPSVAATRLAVRRCLADLEPGATVVVACSGGPDSLALVAATVHEARAGHWRVVGATVDLCERAGKPLVFVVNAATPKAKITSEAAVALSQHGTVAPVTLHHRTDYAASMIDGRTVMEVDPNSRSADEIRQLWSYINDRLEKNFRRTVFSAPMPAQPGYGTVRPMGGGFGRRVAGQ